MSEKVVIGRVRFDIDGERIASLHLDGSWVVEPPLDDARQPVLMDRLAGLSSAYDGPQDGPFGGPQLHEAAGFLPDGEVIEEPEFPEGPPGTVY